MASLSNRLASNMNFEAFSKAEELQKRIWFTLGALIVYRLGSFVPLPGIDPVILQDIFQRNAGGILGMFDMFAGGALSRMTIFALNIMPYISASIIMQLAGAISKNLEQLKKEGESGQRKINQYTRYLTVLICVMQGYGISVGLEGMTGGAGMSAVMNPGLFFRLTTVITLVGGTMFIVWLGEQITARGVGNGSSLIITAGIVANLPMGLAQVLELGRIGQLSPFMILGLLAFIIGVIYVVVFVERAQRRILIQYPKRQKGNRLYGGESSHLPLKLNATGVIPPIFASSLLLLPLTVAGFASDQAPEWLAEIVAMLGRGKPLYLAVFGALIVFFCFFYTAVVFNPQDTADNLKRHGGFVAGIRPGKNTAEYLDYVLTRLTVFGSSYLAILCVLPEFLMTKMAVPVYIGGTTLLIVVTVAMDFVAQVQSHLIAHQYEGLIRKTRLKGRMR